MEQQTIFKKIITGLIIQFCVFTQLSGQAPTLQWATQAGGPSNDKGYAIAIGASGNVYTAGSFQVTADFDPGPGINNLTSTGGNDIFISKSDSAGNLIWVKQMGGGSTDTPFSIHLDADENIYTTGTFYATADFDPGAGAFTLSPFGIFISKLDSSGNFKWAKQLGGTSSDIGYSITTDAAGNVYTSGAFQGFGDFDPGAGTFLLSSDGNNDIFISKLDSAGNFIWAKAIGASFSDQALSIQTDSSGNVYTTGNFASTVDFDPGAGIFNLTSAAGSDDIFILKLDSAGNFKWAKQLGSASADFGRAIALDSWGNVYTCGDFVDTVDFDPAPAVYNLVSGNHSIDVFILKLDSSGNFVWAKQLGGNSGDIANAITVDGSGNVYTTGDFYIGGDFDPGPSTFNMISFGGEDIFISKLDSAGNFVWAAQMGGVSNDIPYGIAADESGSIYATGDFLGTADFDPGAGVTNLNPVGNYDVFTVKIVSSVVTGSSENMLSENIHAFPDPSEGQLNLTTDHILKDATVLLINTTGQTVMEKENISGNQFDIDISELANGLYFIKVLSDTKIIAVQKIIKQ